ncbi:MAG: hypothetical protein II372_03485 [Clostridia bacterium]|nr:hypothetical protein [Clostridia bacterium]
MTNDLKENIEIESENQLDSNMKLLRSLRFQHIVDINMVRVFFVVLLASAVVAMIPTLRPKYSEVEKRDLQTFPRFTFKALVSGDYFDAINLWFSDTFPARDTFVEINTNVTNLFGINTVQVHGKLDEADEIPDVDNIESTQSKPQEESKPAEAPPPPVQPVVEQLGAILIVDNAAFEYYNFKQDVADNYINTLNRAATVLEGKSKVYDMIIPTSMGITLPQSVRDTVKSSDQKSAIDYMYSKMIPAVSRVDCYGKLMSKRDEYIYFRTDHHWTALGAYYSYRELMETMGKAPADLASFTEYRFDGYLGSFYSQSGKRPQLSNTPDHVMAYEPTQVTDIHTVTQTGATVNFPIIRDGNTMSESSKYLSFIGGDNPLGTMINPTITDGSSCLVIKESFGNAMVGFLTQNYGTVYVVDYRYIHKVFPGKLIDFVNERSIQDVIFVNNISATRSPALVNAMASFVG